MGYLEDFIVFQSNTLVFVFRGTCHVFIMVKPEEVQNSNLRSRFFSPELLPLESRVNPVAFAGTVNLASSSVELLMTSTGIGTNANNISISNISSTIIQVDAGAGNTIALTDGTSGNLIVSGAHLLNLPPLT